MVHLPVWSAAQSLDLPVVRPHRGHPVDLAGGSLKLWHKHKGNITLVHVIDNDGSLNEHNTSSHNPFGIGHLKFDELFPAIQQADVLNHWWCFDLCFWPNAWGVIAREIRCRGVMQNCQ